MENEKQHIDIQLLTRSLAGETTPNEQEEIAHWLAGSEANRREYDQLKKTWDLIGRTQPGQAIDVDAEWEHHLELLNRSKKRLFPRTFLRIAAAILILLGLGIFGRQFFAGNSIRTSLAETEMIELPDGSKVTLNAGSKLTYSTRFGEQNREVALRGEAYFEVQKNPDKPFIIQMDDAEIKVLGTAFNVRAYGSLEKIEVTVSEGKVSLYDKRQVQNQVIAIQGEKAVYIRSAKTFQKVENTNPNYLSWKTRLMVFDNTRLNDVASTLSEVYHKEIRIRDRGLNNCRLTTRFEEKDLDTVLKVLESTFDVTWTEERNVISLSGPGCE